MFQIQNLENIRNDWRKSLKNHKHHFSEIFHNFKNENALILNYSLLMNCSGYYSILLDQGFPSYVKIIFSQSYNNIRGSQTLSRFIIIIVIFIIIIIIFSGLRNGREYQVKISALTVNGTGPYTGWLEAATFASDLDESIVPEPPAVLRAKVNIILSYRFFISNNQCQIFSRKNVCCTILKFPN